jgi:hypothetical protein
MKTSHIFTMMFAAFLSASSVCQPVFSQDSDEDKAALEAAHAKLKTTLNEIDGLFFKEVTTDTGYKFYQVIWESNAETSKVSFELRKLGQYGGKPVFGVLAYTTVAQSDGSMPPAVIKAVATKNVRTGIGYFSMADGFDVVYMNFTAPSDTLTAGQIWMTLAYMHDNRVEFKKEIDTLLSASGR